MPRNNEVEVANLAAGLRIDLGAGAAEDDAEEDDCCCGGLVVVRALESTLPRALESTLPVVGVVGGGEPEERRRSTFQTPTRVL